MICDKLNLSVFAVIFVLIVLIFGVHTIRVVLLYVLPLTWCLNDLFKYCQNCHSFALSECRSDWALVWLLQIYTQQWWKMSYGLKFFTNEQLYQQNWYFLYKMCAKTNHTNNKSLYKSNTVFKKKKGLSVVNLAQNDFPLIVEFFPNSEVYFCLCKRFGWHFESMIFNGFLFWFRPLLDVINN